MDFIQQSKYVLLCSVILLPNLASAAASSAPTPKRRIVDFFKRYKSENPATKKSEQEINEVIPIPNRSYIPEYAEPTSSFGETATSSAPLTESIFPTIKKTFTFIKDPISLSAFIDIKANGALSNAVISIPLASNIPEYTVYPPFGFGKSTGAAEALEKAKICYPKWNSDVVTIIETFFREFNSPEQIEKGIEWERTTRLKKRGKEAYQFFDAEVDAIIHDHNQHIMR